MRITKMPELDKVFRRKTLLFISLSLLPNQKSVGVKVWLLLLAALLSLAYVLFLSIEHQKALAQLQSRIDAIHPVTAIKPVLVDKAETRAIQQALNQINTPWERLFSVIESVPLQHVHIVSLSPDAEKTSFLITAKADDVNAMLAFVSALSHQPTLKNVHLLTQQMDTEGKDILQSFSVEGYWVR